MVTKKSTKDAKILFNRSHPRKIPVHKKRMPIVRCTCGSEILVVPDLKAMNIAIDNHVTAKHKASLEDSERLTDFLAEQVLIVATKLNASTSR
jgi:hypothetical protein